MPNDGWGNFPEYADDDGGEMVIDRQKEKQEQRTEPPKMYQVIMLNDDYSEFVFVEEVLRKFFEKSKEQAQLLSFQIHTEGQCVAGVYSREIAESKTAVANKYSQDNDYPLKIIFQQVP